MHPPSRYRLHSSLILLTLFALSIPQLHAGTLTPTGDNPIDASVANENEIADYTFTFIPDTTIPTGGTLTVTFPTQYTFGLGIPLLPTCSVTCSVSGFQVIFTFDSPVLNNVTSSVTIESVQNPATKGGTGNFQLVSQTGDNVLDENLIFGVIGIADTIGLLTSTLVSLDSSGVLNAGEVTKYSFSFKVSQVIPAGSYMKFNISDENFGLSSYPSCAAFSINSKIITGKLVCQTVGREIVITGLSADIPAAQDVGITVSMTNPRYSGLTDGFSIAIYRNGTNAIYDRRTDIAGIPITAGQFSNVALTKVDSTAIQARNKMMDYTLTFLPKNALELGSVIVLTFPTNFVYDTTLSNSQVILSGLDDISEDVTVDLDVSVANIITISNYKAIAIPAQITLQVRLTNPDNIGETTPVYIRTYTDSTLATLIDEDITSAVTSIQNYPSPSSHNISIGAVQTTYAIPSLEFFFIPSVSVPNSGIIKVEVPSDFTVSTVKTTSCFVLSLNTFNQSWIQAANCYNIDNLITITLPSANTFPLGSWAGFRLDSVITTPIYNGTFLFDMTTYKAGGTTPIESWTEPMSASSVPFADAVIDSLCYGIGKTTILTTIFTTDFTIPAGIKQTTASDTKGFIELVFYNITSANLGATSTSKQSVPCRPAAGLSPLSSGAINCTLFPGSIPVIRIDNFQEINAGTVISFGFPAITNPSINFQVMLKTISFTNRIRTELNSMQLEVNVSTPVALTESGTVGSSAYVFSSNQVSTYSNITFNPGTSTDITGPGTFIIEMPFYDTGYVPLSNSIGCKLDTTYYPCTRYYQADWITIWLPTGSTFYTGKTITLENVAIPRYSNVATSGPLLRFIMSSNHQERVNRPQQYFTSASVPTFYQADLIANRKSQGAVNAEYILTFASKNMIPAGASLIITFPSAYSLLVSYPPVRFSSPDLVDISSTQTVTFTPNVQTLTVSNFASVPAQTAFSIVVNGIRNPSTVASSVGWIAKIMLGSYLMVSQSNFDQFTFTPALSPGTITFNSIIALPMNANQYADYTISFVPATEIPIGGQVRITFPSTAYSSLPNPPDCSVSGGITTFARCTLSGNTYTIELDADYSTGGIAVTIKSVMNPGVGTTDGFVVRTYYDSTFLDNTDTTDLTGRTVTIVDEPDILSVKSITYDPMNEGESATYTFSFLPTNPITTSMEIQFIFPDVYDQLLGETISCDTVAGLDGDVGCSVNNRVVTATGFDTYEPDADNPIIINIYGVVNPNQNINTDTGQFKIATLATTSYVFVDYNAAAGAFEMLPAPDWSPLFNISATNLDTRLDADYTFNFTSYDGILSTASQGAVLIDFPSDFTLSSGTLTCVSKTTAFASSSALSCSVANNRVTISGQPSFYTGNVVLVAQDILNPVEEGTAGNIVLKTYDGFNKKILERSYKNLDPFTFAYTYPGPQITVNDNKVIRVERGTQSQDIYITVDFPCALDLVFKPTTPGFSIIPFNVPLSLGDIQAGFRVAVPQSFAEGTYYIEWETMNENDPPYYTPLKKTTVIVTSLTNLRITVPTLYEIPYGGNSLPSPFTVSYGPDIGFEITLEFAGTSTGILLDRKNVIFRAGDQSSTFTVYASNDSSYASTRVDRGTLDLAITGVNKGVYALASTSIDFLVIDADTVAPDITELSITDITMNTATIIIGSSEICIAYYMIALAGTATPTLDEVMNQGPAPYTTTQSVYGTATIGTENRVEIAITGLVAETPYQVYVYIIDRGGNTNDPRTETFNTLDRYNAATFSLNFKQSFLNSAEIQLIINEVAFVLSLPPAKVQQRKYVITVSSSTRLLEEEPEHKQLTDGGRVLGGDSAVDSTQLATTEDQNPDAKYMLTSSDSTVIYLQIMATPQSAVYPSPLNLALLLNGATRKSELNSLLSNYDTTYTVTATEFTRYQPGFPVTPACSSLSWSWAAITGTLNNYGYIFTVFLKAAEDLGKPSPYQIAQGFNSANIQNSHGSVEVSTAYVDFTVNVTGLDPLTDYNVYVVGGSAHPGYPDLGSADSIVIITIKTEAAPVTPHLNINGGSIIEVSYVAVLFVVTVLLSALM